MSKYRQAARTDSNQSEIVAALRDIPGVCVALGHDDIFVSYRGINYWFEIKAECPLKKNGKPKRGMIKKSQEELLRTWTGHYNIVWTLDQILLDMGIL